MSWFAADVCCCLGLVFVEMVLLVMFPPVGSYSESVVGSLVLSVISSVRDDFAIVSAVYLDIMLSV